MLRPYISRWRYFSLWLGSWLLIFFLTRLGLWLSHWPETAASVGQGLQLLLTGGAYDLGFLAFAGVPLACYVALCPNALWQQRWHQHGLQLVLGLLLLVMGFVAVAEWLFWDEFGVRFNFIAVDYLVYSKEVIDNILQSYPVFELLAVLALAAASVTFCLSQTAWQPVPVDSIAPTPIAARYLGLAAWGVLALSVAGLMDQTFPRSQAGNSYQRELAANGPYQFFAAFRNNELDYLSFYASLADQPTAQLLRSEVTESHAQFLATPANSIRRQITHSGPAKPLNVVLVTIESLSAKYLGSFGDNRGLTPNLDQLRQHSLSFSQMYATGTRTDRGLEAITLSIPPTPGRSIVKRLGRETGYASLGQQLANQGYDAVFVYGGRGYFDNMNAFFSGNGYRIVDQSSVPDAELSFTNAWGMADEDLYRQAVKLADADFAKQQPFFLQLMTTSNHRPYTFPQGRIDLASGSGREAAVKYTDYAIGQFLAVAKTKPWFDDTIFVFVADHTAGSAGKEDLPIANYHIPLFIYSPQHIPAQAIELVTSQIDLAPTLLGLLNVSYESTFFGRDVLRAEAQHKGRALIGNYQHLGLFDGQDVAILSPRKQMRRHDHALQDSQERSATREDSLIQRAISYYQGASAHFQQGWLGWKAAQGVQP